MERPESEKGTTHTNMMEHDPLLGVEIQFSNMSFPVKAVIDTGAPSSTINLELAEKLGWQLRSGRPLLVASPDGSIVESCKIVSAPFTMGADESRKFQIVANVIPTSYPIRLGLSWLRQNRFKINPIKRTLDQSDYSVECTFYSENLSKIPLELWEKRGNKGQTGNNRQQHNDSQDVLTSAPEPGEQPQDKGKPHITPPAIDPKLILDIQFSKSSFPVKALIDTGSSGCIVSTTIAEKIGITGVPPIPSACTPFDATQLKSTGVAFGTFTIGANFDRKFELRGDILPSSRECILGLSWLRQNGFIINPMTRTLEGPDYLIRCGIEK